MRRLVALVAAAVVVSSGLSGCGLIGGGGSTYRVTAYFPSAISLYPKSQVRVLGLPAGHVNSIKVLDTRVRVVMSIPTSIPVPANVSATIIPLSLVGERYVQLFPAWKNGEAKLKPNSVIPLARTSVPVEPDEALAALKHLLDSIDPQATGKLVTNLAADLKGTGKDLNDALNGLGTITETLGSKSDEIAAIIDHFDQLTATLATRDQVLGRVLDNFATTTSALADERTAIQSLLSSLASLATNGLDLASEHHVKLDHDLTVLSRTLRLVGAHTDQLNLTLAAAPLLVSGPNHDGKAGLIAAYDRSLHALDLRTELSPDLYQAFQALGLGGVPVCLPIDVNCVLPVPAAPASASASPASAKPSVALPAVPTPAAKRARAVATSSHSHKGGIAGFLHAVSSVFG